MGTDHHINPTGLVPKADSVVTKGDAADTPIPVYQDYDPGDFIVSVFGVDITTGVATNRIATGTLEVGANNVAFFRHTSDTSNETLHFVVYRQRYGEQTEAEYNTHDTNP